MSKKKRRFAMLVNIEKCVGCYACQVSCKSEYNIPFGTYRCRVKTYGSGQYPRLKKFFFPRFCNHCDNPPCIEACDEKALYKNSDGVVLLKNNKCTGCQQCEDKCPYNAIEVNHVTGLAEKCDFCYEKRLVKGLTPVCVQSCMGKAILFGDMYNTASKISKALRNSQIKVIQPELETHPAVYYTSKRDVSISPLSHYKEIENFLDRGSKYNQNPVRKDIENLFFTSDAMCPSECGLSVLVEDGMAKKIYGNPHTLINNGTLCAKGASGLQMTYSPHRIRTPLLRAGKRGEEKWKEITWEEASGYIAKKLIAIKKKYGPESVFLDCGDVTDREAYYRLFHAFGTPNTFHHGSICDPNRRWGQGIMTGDERPLPDIQRPFLIRNDDGEPVLKTSHDIKLLLNIGVNPFVASRFNYMSSGIPAAREENRCVYIVIDPAFTNSAAHADIWLSIIPGADAALLAAMLHYIIKNDSPVDDSKKYIDDEFIKKYTWGWKEFKNSFLLQSGETDKSNDLRFFTVEWAADKTGISEENIRKISHLFGITKPAAIEIGMHGTSHHSNGDVSSILMTALCLITGNMDCPGGLVFIDSQKAKKGSRIIGTEFLDKTVTRKINGADAAGNLSDLHKDFFGDYPAAWKGVLTDLPQKIREGIHLSHGPFKGLRYPVKAFIARAGNPVISAGNTQDWINAVTAEDSEGNYKLEILAFIDTHVNETGKYADLVLPEAGFLERMGLSDVYTMSPEIAIRDQVIKPLHKSKPPFKIMMSLSSEFIRHGDPDIKAEYFNIFADEEDFINQILSEAPGYYNVGDPLPYPELPEGCLIVGAPDNPRAIWGKTVIKEGELVTAEWLRKHNGVAVWPAGYTRYKIADGSPSGMYPRTKSGKFEFSFNFLKTINKELGTNFPTTFYWSECKWNPKNKAYEKIREEYPFQLISGRSHHTMTMTGVCYYLAETETECLKPLNDAFNYKIPEITNDKNGLPVNKTGFFESNTVSIPVLAMNKKEGGTLKLKTGDTVILENALEQRLKGKIFLTDDITPGVIKMAFGPGGQDASGTGLLRHTSAYTQNINKLVDSKNMSAFTGMPGFGDIMVKIVSKNQA